MQSNVHIMQNRFANLPIMNTCAMNWDDLKIIDALGTTGSLSGAARLLGVNHSTIYRRVGALELQLGARLFDRHRTGYQPTPSGEDAIRVAQRMKQDINDLDRRLSGKDMRLEGTLRIATTDTLLPFLASLIAVFNKEYPGITLELVTSNEFANLTKRDCDIAFRPSNSPTDTLVGRKLGKIPSAVYASTSYLGRFGNKTELKDHDWIGFDDTLRHLSYARWLENIVLPEKIVMRANTLPGILSALHNGLGVAVLPCFMTADLNDIRCLMASIDGLETDLWLLTHADLQNTARVRAFMDFTNSNHHILQPLFQIG
jgi:DNA-binding transcriptional LysR family regulator